MSTFYFQGGYFIINGSEKVLIAQERTAANQVYVFAKAPPSAVTYQAEIRSAVEKGGKTVSQMTVKMMAAKASDVRPLIRSLYDSLAEVLSLSVCQRRTSHEGRLALHS